jgi:hypothetical protein
MPLAKQSGQKRSNFPHPDCYYGVNSFNFSQSVRMEKAIIKACAGILVGVSVLITTLWNLANYIWEE